jgi:hypothetical protein
MYAARRNYRRWSRALPRAGAPIVFGHRKNRRRRWQALIVLHRDQ